MKRGKPAVEAMNGETNRYYSLLHEAAKEQRKEAAKVGEVKATELATIEPMTVAPADLEARMKLESQRRKVLTDYISKNMVEGKDYGTIKIMTRSGAQVESKPTLFKPGAEKFCSLFGLQATFNKDEETWQMLGDVPGMVAYICVLKTKQGTIVGEGRGVADIKEKQGWTANNCVKIAEKRAQIDAVLRSGGLSDFFTQDLEDAPDKEYSARESLPPASSGKVTEKQLRFMFVLMRERGFTKERLEDNILKRFSVIGLENLSLLQAKGVIEALQKLPLAPKPKEEDVPTIHIDEERGEEENPLLKP